MEHGNSKRGVEGEQAVIDAYVEADSFQVTERDYGTTRTRRGVWGGFPPMRHQPPNLPARSTRVSQFIGGNPPKPPGAGAPRCIIALGHLAAGAQRFDDFVHGGALSGVACKDRRQQPTERLANLRGQVGR